MDCTKIQDFHRTDVDPSLQERETLQLTEIYCPPRISSKAAQSFTY
jgi:hypothetical protein